MATKRDNEKSTEKAVDECAELLLEILQALTFKPDKVNIDVHDKGTGLAILEISNDQADYGVIYGKSGRQIQALQTLFRFIGLRSKTELRLVLKECERDRRDIPAPFMPDIDWKPDKAVALLEKVLKRMLLEPFKIDVISLPNQATFEIKASGDEQKVVAAYQPYLHTTFHAIGRADGHSLYIGDAKPLPSVI